MTESKEHLQARIADFRATAKTLRNAAARADEQADLLQKALAPEPVQVGEGVEIDRSMFVKGYFADLISQCERPWYKKDGE